MAQLPSRQDAQAVSTSSKAGFPANMFAYKR